MSNQEIDLKRESQAIHYERPICPQCRRRMKVKQVSPAFATGIDDMVYACEDCGTEATGTMRRG